MSAKLKYGIALAALIGLQHLITSDAFAITAGAAKECDVLTDKTYPSRVPGNPAAGRLNGTPQEIQKYFNKCLVNGGNEGNGGKV